MGLLDDVQADDMRFAFCDTDAFADTVEYINSDGMREYSAVIARDDVATIEEGRTAAISYRVVLSRDSDGTLGPASISRGGDTITLPSKWGSGIYTVRRILDQDAAAWTLLIY